MDFVVVGFGMGPLGVLLGVLLRGWLAGRCERAALRAADPALAAYERANAAECRGAGQAFLAAGGAVVLATIGGLAGGLDDRSGALLVTTTATVAALGIILWGFLYRSRNPLPTRPRRQAPATSAGGVLVMESQLAPAATSAAGPALAVANDAIDPGGQDTATGVGEAEEPTPAEPTEPAATPEAMLAMETAESEADDVLRQDADVAANGHPVAAEGEQGKIVAFVGRGARAQAGDDVVRNDTDDDGSDGR